MGIFLRLFDFSRGLFFAFAFTFLVLCGCSQQGRPAESSPQTGQPYLHWPANPPPGNFFHGSGLPGPSASARYIGSPCVVIPPASITSQVLMYYAGTRDSGEQAIYVAGSSDGGLNFAEIGVALAAGSPGRWDDEAMDTPFVHWNNDLRQFQMWYMGNSAANHSMGGDPNYHSRIGIAWSGDGIHWTRAAEPVFDPGASGWDSLFVADPSVVYRNGTYYMAYTGVQAYPVAAIGLATSADGIHWVKHNGNPVIAATQPWDSVLCSSPSLTFVEDGVNAGTWIIWYHGTDAAFAPYYNVALGAATSKFFTGPWIPYAGNPIIRWPQDPAKYSQSSWYLGPVNVHVILRPPAAGSLLESYVMYYETGYGFGRIESEGP